MLAEEKAHTVTEGGISSIRNILGAGTNELHHSLLAMVFKSFNK